MTKLVTPLVKKALALESSAKSRKRDDYVKLVAPLVKEALDKIHREADRADGVEHDPALWSTRSQDMLEDYIEALQMWLGWLSR